MATCYQGSLLAVKIYYLKIKNKKNKNFIPKNTKRMNFYLKNKSLFREEKKYHQIPPKI